jgi:hypothetical protein
LASNDDPSGAYKAHTEARSREAATLACMDRRCSPWMPPPRSSPVPNPIELLLTGAEQAVAAVTKRRHNRPPAPPRLQPRPQT